MDLVWLLEDYALLWKRSTVRQRPGFPTRASPPTIRALPLIPSELHSYSRPRRPKLAASRLRTTLPLCASWLFRRLSFMSYAAYSSLPSTPCARPFGPSSLR